jgi:hypothetical protein
LRRAIPDAGQTASSRVRAGFGASGFTLIGTEPAPMEKKEATWAANIAVNKTQAYLVGRPDFVFT